MVPEDLASKNIRSLAGGVLTLFVQIRVDVKEKHVRFLNGLRELSPRPSSVPG